MSEQIVTRESIAADLRRLGVRAGGVLLIHSSLKSLGRVDGGAEAVIGALQDVVTDAGTLVTPTLTYDAVDADRPRFDVRRTPSCVGLITEVFRTSPGVRRSLHPTHSLAAWGRLRDEIIAGHERCASAGPLDSPWRRLVERGAQVLFLGVGLHVNTLLHCVEEWAEAPGSLTESTQALEVVDENGRILPCPQHRHAGRRSRFYAKMEPLFESWGCLTRGRVGAADCRLIDAPFMARRTETLLRTVDPALFTHDRLPPTTPEPSPDNS